MLGWVFLFIGIFFGYTVSRSLFPKINWFEQIGSGLIVGLISGTWLVYLFSFLFSYQISITVVMVLLSQLGLWLLTKSNKTSFQKISASSLYLVIIWICIFAVLFYNSSFLIKNDGWYTLPYSYGDLALHGTIIHHFANQERLSLVNPILSTQNLGYPFLIDFHTALLIKMGMSIQSALIVTGLLVMTAFIILLDSFCYYFSKKHSISWIANGIFLLNGGVAWSRFFQDMNGYSFFEFVQKLPFDYTNLDTAGIVWTNVITTHILPQRGFMLGLSTLMLVLFLLQNIWQEKKLSLIKVVIVAVLLGSLPLFHSHSFLLGFPLFAWILLQARFQNKVSTFSIVLVLGISLAIALPQLLYLTQEKSQSFLGFMPGWLHTGNWLVFWLKNLGAALAVYVLSIYAYFNWMKQSFERHLIIPNLAVFIICNIFIFQPNAWDNMKFFELAYLVPCIAAASIMGQFTNTYLKKSISSIIIVLAIIPGIISILYVLQNSSKLISNSELSVAKEIQKIEPNNAIFLTAYNHNHPVTMIAGRTIVLGYPGWLWTHGVDYARVSSDIENMYAGDPSAVDLIKQYNISYVVVGNFERAQHQVNEVYFQQHFPSVLVEEDTVVYKVTQ